MTRVVSPREGLVTALVLLMGGCSGEFVSNDNASDDVSGDAQAPPGPGEPDAQAPPPVDAGIPPVTEGTDDWTELGHDPGRSFASTDRVAPPLHTLWTWMVASNPDLLYAANAVSIDGKVRAHVAGNRQQEHQNSNSPYLQSLDLATGADAGRWWTENAPIGIEFWYSATPKVTIITDDFCGAVDTMTHETAFICDEVINVCQLGDVIGETTVDLAGGRYYAINEQEFHMPGEFGPEYCIPPANLSAYTLTGGQRLWTANLSRYPTRTATSIAFAAGAVYAAVHVTNGPPVDGSPMPEDGVYSLDGASGAGRWFVPSSAQTSYRSLSTDGTRVHVAVSEGGSLKVAVLGAADGHTLATSPALGASRRALPPGRLGERLVVYTGDALYALERGTGAILWSVTGLDGDIGDGGSSFGRVLDNAYAISGDGTVYVTTKKAVRAYALEDGSPVWTQDVSATLGKVGPPILARGRLLVVGEKAIVALGP